MDSVEQLKALETYFQLMSMKGVVEVFHAARQAGVLEALAGGRHTAAALAVKCGLCEKPTALLLRALYAAGIVQMTGEEYLPMPVLHFLSGTYQDLSNQYWVYLPSYLETGRPMQRMDDPEEGRKHYVEQARSLRGMMLPSAMAAAGMLGIGTHLKNLSILDVGAGSGVWGQTFALHDPQARITAIDWPNVLEMARHYAGRSGLGDRFQSLPGSYHEVELESARYDLAITANVVHLETEDGILRLFRRLHAALKPGGHVLVVDVFHDQPDGELNASLYELGLALRTEHGRVFGQESLSLWLREAGFPDPRYRPIPVTPFTMGLIFAQRGLPRPPTAHD
jgi:2-polyprenyl-3-methyl-5-hydroxy-6-metoxy-1,4-benzoquinol methylase